MCGIYGWQLPNGTVTLAERVALAALLGRGNDTRGGESWGYWDGQHVAKGLNVILPLSVRIAASEVMMAHTRKATTGKVVAENSHPYQVGKILGAHNGMIFNHDELLKKHGRSYDVDSMHLFGHIDQGLGFDDLEGYGAIEYVNTDDPSSIMLCKMKGGELSVFGIGPDDKNVKGVVWSSNDTHLKDALQAAGLTYFPYKVEEGKQYRVKGGVLYLTDLPDLVLAGRTSYSGSTNRWGHWEGSWGAWEGGKACSTGKSSAGRKDKDEPEVKAINVLAMGDRFMDRIEEGKVPTPESFHKWSHDMRQALVQAIDMLSQEIEDDDGSCLMMMEHPENATVQVNA